MELYQVQGEGGVHRVCVDKDDAECCAVDQVFEALAVGRDSSRAVVRYPDGRVLSLVGRWVGPKMPPA